MSFTCPNQEASVCAVIVTWRPQAAMLEQLLDALLPQVGATVIVDNASGAGYAPTLDAARARGCTVLAQASNAGLAAGFNRGIEWARARDSLWVLLLDQDSVPASDMVARLRMALERPRAGAPVAAAGACFIDPRDGRSEGFVRFALPRHRRLRREPGVDAIECDHLISSGCLLRASALDVVGAMDESLFIDNVDLEWGMRVRARGHVLIGVWDARLEHHLGDSRRRLFPLLPLQTPVHSPQRLYYMMRNRVLLYRRPMTPRLWVVHDLPRVPLKLLVFALLVPPRWKNLRWMLRGLADAVRGRTGPAPGS